MSRYSWLILAVALAALGVTALGRAPARRVPSARERSVHAGAVRLQITLHEGSLAPVDAVVPKGRRVLLLVENEGSREATLTLRGYEDRLPSFRVPAGETVRRELLADRPGEDFPWLLDGSPVGRVTVSGSHLIEGHR